MSLKYGIDDFLVAFGPVELRAVLDAAKPPAKPPKRQAATIVSPQAESTVIRDDQPKYALTDIGNAERFVFQHSDTVRHVWHGDKSGEWYAWGTTGWRRNCTPIIHQKAIATVRSIYSECSRESDAATRTSISRHATASESAKFIDAMLRTASKMSAIAASIDDFDRMPFLLNVENGTVDLTTGKLQMHRREDFITKLAPVKFDPHAKCPRWEAFVKSVFVAPELISFMQRLLGYCCTGDASEHVLPIFWGGGANGKSTLINVMAEVLGDYAAKAPQGLLMQKHGEQHPTELTVLQGARFVYASETKRGGRLSEDLVKDLTSGERITARRMRMDFYSFQPTHKLILCTNHQPRIGETDDGIWRRLRLIPFKTRFWNPDNEEIGPEDLRQDKSLGDKLKLERPGILNWLIAGALSWRREGLAIPECVKAETENYRADEDTFGQFMTEIVSVSNEHGKVTLKQFSFIYREWCNSQNIMPMNSRNVSAELKRRGIRVDRGSANKMYVFGVSLSTVDTSEAQNLDRYGD